jgi:hypothetical protein
MSVYSEGSCTGNGIMTSAGGADRGETDLTGEGRAALGLGAAFRTGAGAGRLLLAALLGLAFFAATGFFAAAFFATDFFPAAFFGAAFFAATGLRLDAVLAAAFLEPAPERLEADPAFADFFALPFFATLDPPARFFGFLAIYAAPWRKCLHLV